MSFQLPTQRQSHAPASRWSGAAFLIEAMLLLVFVMASLAVFTQMFAASVERSNQSVQLTDAVAAASTVAEQFAADPAGAQAEQVMGDMRVVCKVTPESLAGGVLYRAQIYVYATDGHVAGDPDSSRESGGTAGLLYSVSTSKYESGA